MKKNQLTKIQLSSDTELSSADHCVAAKSGGLLHPEDSP